MKVTSAQARYLRAIATLGAGGTPPTSSAVAAALDVGRRNVVMMVRALRDRGLVVARPDDLRLRRVTGLRLTARARLLLGEPVLAYLAWPIPGMLIDGGADARIEVLRGISAELERTTGLVCVSPLFMPGDAARAGAELARRCDLVVLVHHEPLLSGQGDVVAARRSGVPLLDLQGGLDKALSDLDKGLWVPADLLALARLVPVPACVKRASHV